jgi:hypothetical protein
VKIWLDSLRVSYRCLEDIVAGVNIVYAYYQISPRRGKKAVAFPSLCTAFLRYSCAVCASKNQLVHMHFDESLMSD